MILFAGGNDDNQQDPIQICSVSHYVASELESIFKFLNRNFFQASAFFIINCVLNDLLKALNISLCKY